MNLSKAQFYGGDGTGRDTYIYMSNGGFCPEKMPTKIDGISMYTFNDDAIFNFNTTSYLLAISDGIFIYQPCLFTLYNFYRFLRYPQIKTSRASGLHSL